MPHYDDDLQCKRFRKRINQIIKDIEIFEEDFDTDPPTQDFQKHINEAVGYLQEAKTVLHLAQKKAEEHESD